MSETSLGRIRVVNYDSPWLPPRAFEMDDICDDWLDLVCHALIPVRAVEFTDEQAELVNFDYEDFVCTRGHHGADEIHVCHYHSSDKHSPAFAIVWGGE